MRLAFAVCGSSCCSVALVVLTVAEALAVIFIPEKGRKKMF